MQGVEIVHKTVLHVKTAIGMTRMMDNDTCAMKRALSVMDPVM